jgi:parallel beta-helix repeat protein
MSRGRDGRGKHDENIANLRKNIFVHSIPALRRVAAKCNYKKSRMQRFGLHHSSDISGSELRVESRDLMKHAVLIIISMALAPGWALAQNGVALINQSIVAAMGSNRTTGGFPYVITQPGSYQLSGNLTVPGVNGIVISASFVSLDLNGFSISCVGSCSGNGITDNGTPQSGITIRNGTGLGFNNGVLLQGVVSQATTACFIEKVTAQSNASTGINVGNSSTIKDCIALNNGGNGINAGAHGVVSGSVASGNGGVGINVLTGTLTGNTAHGNLGNGILVLGNSSLSGNTASKNVSFGIEVGASSTLTGNTASANNVGFNVVCPVNVVGNTAVGNTQFDIDVNALGAVRCNFINNLINTLGP